jgi:hypothetical protein
MRSRCFVCVCVCARARVSVCVSPLSLLGNGPVKVPLSLLGNGSVENEYKRNNRRIVGRVVFNVARVVSRKVGD